ncbi:MAG: protein DpdD [Enhygromyxa sp.]
MPDRSQREALARNFFRAPNQIQWSAYQAGRLSADTANRIAPWIDRLLRGVEPVVLPFAHPHGTTWYAATKTGRAFRHLQEELKSFLGQTYSDFEGQPTHLDPNLPSEQALAECYGQHVIRLRVRREDREIARQRLEMFVRLRDEAPERGDAVPRPAGRILADFDEALRLGNDPEADLCIEELERNGQLDAQNLLYLRVRVNEARGRWKDVRDAARRYGLFHPTRRPRRVSQAILRAVYATDLAEYEANADAPGALQRFHQSVRSLVEPLLTARSLYDCVEVDTLFLMLGIANAGTRADIQPLLDEINPDNARRPWLEALVATLHGHSSAPPVESRPEPARDPLIEARNAQFEGDLDRAWSLAQTLVPGEGTAQIVIRCAWDLGTLEAAEFAISSFEALSPDARDRLQQRNSIANALEQLRSLAAPPSSKQPVEVVSHVPQNWLEWAEAVLADQNWAGAAEVAKRGADEWDPGEFSSPERATSLAEALAGLDKPGWARIWESLPYVLASVARCEELPRQVGGVLECLANIHLMDEAPGRLFFSTLASLCGLTLQVGVGDQAYTDLLEESLRAIEDNAGAADFDGLLEFLDVLVTHAAPVASLRTAVAGAVANLFVRFKRKADAVHLDLLPRLLTEAACELPAPLQPTKSENDRVNPLATLAGKTIALYSLKENVLHRVATLLRTTVPDIRVTTFCDRAGGSQALRAAARGTDIFVIATAAATHAATGFIEAERPDGAPVLKPAGQGSASMLRSLHEFAARS